MQSVEFLKIKGKQVAILDVANWQPLIEWLETLEDLQITKQALNKLKAARGNRDRAGWLDWEALKDKWDED